MVHECAALRQQYAIVLSPRDTMSSFYAQRGHMQVSNLILGLDVSLAL